MKTQINQIGLLGFMGTGKTTVGKILAETLGWRFFDTDQLIERRTGMTISQIFTEKGETAFREIEHEVVSDVCRHPRAVISFGGGVPLDSRNRRIIEKRTTAVLLRASPATIIQRTANSRTRPLLEHTSTRIKDEIASLLRERETCYSKFKEIEVITDGLSAKDVADIIIGRLIL